MNPASDEAASVVEIIGNSPRALSALTSKPELLDLLLRSLETLIFFEIGILYCCDNLSFLFAVRALSQVLYVHEKPPVIPPSSLAPTILGNLLCIITHIFHSRPEATARSARGWIHGGLLVEFVGELGPISKWRLITYDLLIAGLQILMLIIGHEKRKASGEYKETTSTPQDLEAEEAGVRKSQDEQDEPTDPDGIEMDTLLPSGSKEGASSSSRRGANDDGLIATINIKKTLKAITQRRPPAVPPATSGEAEQGADRMRTLLGALITGRAGPTTS